MSEKDRANRIVAALLWGIIGAFIGGVLRYMVAPGVWKFVGIAALIGFVLTAWLREAVLDLWHVW